MGRTTIGKAQTAAPEDCGTTLNTNKLPPHG